MHFRTLRSTIVHDLLAKHLPSADDRVPDSDDHALIYLLSPATTLIVFFCVGLRSRPQVLFIGNCVQPNLLQIKKTLPMCNFFIHKKEST